MVADGTIPIDSCLVGGRRSSDEHAVGFLDDAVLKRAAKEFKLWLVKRISRILVEIRDYWLCDKENLGVFGITANLKLPEINRFRRQVLLR